MESEAQFAHSSHMLKSPRGLVLAQQACAFAVQLTLCSCEKPAESLAIEKQEEYVYKGERSGNLITIKVSPSATSTRTFGVQGGSDFKPGGYIEEPISFDGKYFKYLDSILIPAKIVSLKWQSGSLSCQAIKKTGETFSIKCKGGGLPVMFTYRASTGIISYKQDCQDCESEALILVSKLGLAHADAR